MSSGGAYFGGERPPDPWAGRRQVDELTADELRAQPAWWFPGRTGAQLSGPDEATVMPIDASAADADGAVDFPAGRYLLHATFVLADGTRLGGHVTFSPDDDGSLAAREPTICADRGQVALWFGTLTPTDAHLAPLGRPRGAVFPVQWTATLHPPGVALSGELGGFAVLRDGRVTTV